MRRGTAPEDPVRAFGVARGAGRTRFAAMAFRGLVAWSRRALSGRARWVLGALLGLALAIGAAGVLFPRWVRAAVVQRAADRGLVAEVGRVALGARGIWLLDVRLRDPSLERAEADLGAVRVRLGFGGVRGVDVFGGRVELRASASRLAARLRALRGGGGDQARDTKVGGPELHAEGIDLQLASGGDPRQRARLWGARLGPASEGGVRISADLAKARAGRWSAAISFLELDVLTGDSPRVRRVGMTELEGRLEVGPWPDDGGPDQPGGNADAVAPAPWAALRASAGNWIAESFEGSVSSLQAEVVREGERLRIGPNLLKAHREGQNLLVELSPRAGAPAGEARLSLKARIPFGEGPGEIELRGGPISLATLGVHEGDFGLIAVRQARIEAQAHLLSRDVATVEFDSRGHLENARLFRPALSSRELSGIEIGWNLQGTLELDGSRVALSEGEITLGRVRGKLKGFIERAVDHTLVDLVGSVPVGACGDLLTALPRGAAPLLDGVRMSGTFRLEARVKYDSRDVTNAEVALEVDNECRVTHVPEELDPRRFRGAWLRQVRGPDGTPIALESGPSTADWTPYEEISRHMETGVIVCEDAGFFRHRGFDYRAIEKSIRDNLVAERFLRGASTVSMQLAKNLYLEREKTLSRKLQEAVFTLLLEQELSKHELMELYLNVVEFGAGIYGVRRAARHYFSTDPANLSLGQALFLTSILPNPDVSHFQPDGSLSERWAAYLRKLMGIAHQIGRISDEELSLGLSEEIGFRRPLEGDGIDGSVEEGGAGDEATPEPAEP